MNDLALVRSLEPVVETAPRPAPVVSARNVSLTLGGRRILDHVSVALHPGEIVTLIGPNGAGKSTLVRVLLGLIAPDEGAVERAPGLWVGYVPQRFQAPETVPLSVARLITLTRPAPASAIHAVLAETGIEHLAERPVQALSGGEMQRALIARALLHDPGLLVLDEPVQGVDFIGEARLYALIASIRQKRGCAILMVSHDLHMVMAESDRVVCLNGHVCCEGVPDRVKSDPEFVKMFGPEAARALGVYSHHHDHVHPDGRANEHE